MENEVPINKVVLKESDVLVRMYKVGFGDCFLIAYKQGDQTKKILVDCGSIAKHKLASNEIVKKIIEHVTVDNVAKIDVVIATHRHKDHVSGFAKPGWEDVEVDEVWLPWTENTDDKEANRIRNSQSSFALAMANSLSLDSRFGPEEIEEGWETEKILSFNALSNERAMSVLHYGFAGNPKRRFFPKNGTVGEKYVNYDLLPGVITHILGPSKEESVIRDMDPPIDQSYLARNIIEGNKDNTNPFSNEWVSSGRPKSYKLLDYAKQETWKNDEKEIREINLGLPKDFAVALDKAVNGTSLMLMFELKNHFLLFPGDAQWGTWSSVLDNKQASKLLERTTFYKVGHHGSHNSTPKDFIDKILSKGDRNKRVGMVSVSKRNQWKEIPKKELLTNLRKKIKSIALSNARSSTNAFTDCGDVYIDKIL